MIDGGWFDPSAELAGDKALGIAAGRGSRGGRCNGRARFVGCARLSRGRVALQ